MNAIRTSLCLALLVSLTACQDRTPSAQAPTNTRAAQGASGAPETALGRTVASAIDKARAELESGNIDLGDGVRVRVGRHGHQIDIGNDAHDGRPKGEITPQGDLLIDGKAVAITPAQRELLLRYRRELIGVAEAGMEVGVRGADLAGKALAETFSGLIHGDAESAGKRIEAEGEKIKDDARRICVQLPAMLRAQEELAASLPAFRPYATMTQADIDDCMKDDRGVAVTDGSDPTAGATRDAVRDRIRESVRNAVRVPSGDTGTTDTADQGSASAAR